jgi:CBS domain-containing protein
MKQVKDYMYKDITTLSEHSTLRRVITVMKRHRMSAVSIVDHQGHLLGCVMAQDILDASIPNYIKSIHNTSFMAQIDQITTHLGSLLDEKATRFIDHQCARVAPTDSMSYAADLLSRDKRTILPVVEGKNQIGWITKIDIISMALGEQPDDNPADISNK